MTNEQVALVSKALAHPARVRIVKLLAAQTECRGREVFSELELAQSTVSEHLRLLKAAGLVNAAPVGTAMVYCLVKSVLDDYRRAIDMIASSAAVCSSVGGGC